MKKRLGIVIACLVALPSAHAAGDAPPSAPAAPAVPPAPADPPVVVMETPPAVPLDCGGPFRGTVTAVAVEDGHRGAGLTDTIVVTLGPGELAQLQARARCHRRDWGLFLNGWFLPGVTPLPAGGTDRVRFYLARTDDNKQVWTKLLTKQLLHPAPVPLSVGLDDGSEIADGGKLTLEVITGWKFGAGAALFVLLLVMIFVQGSRTTLLRDSGLRPATPSPRDPHNLGTFSLSRVQMAWWTVLVAFGLAFIWAVTGELMAVTPSLLALMGMSAGTALGAALVDENKRGTMVASLMAKKAELQQEVEDLNAKIGTATPPTPGQIEALVDTLQKIDGQLGGATDGSPYHVEASVGLLNDILTDANGYSLHRLQLLIWTGVVSLVFVGTVVSRLVLPDIDTTMLALLGISNGTYLGFKLPEKG
jgi:hypothetical protein